MFSQLITMGINELGWAGVICKAAKLAVPNQMTFPSLKSSKLSENQQLVKIVSKHLKWKHIYEYDWALFSAKCSNINGNMRGGLGG